jgi:hypothetical protein
LENTINKGGDVICSSDMGQDGDVGDVGYVGAGRDGRTMPDREPDEEIGMWQIDDDNRCR